MLGGLVRGVGGLLGGRARGDGIGGVEVGVGVDEGGE